jgi:hypothetical protein
MAEPPNRPEDPRAAATADAGPELDPLAMALNLLAAVGVLGEAIDADPLGARVRALGNQGFESALLAARLATISIAEDVRRIADHLTATARRERLCRSSPCHTRRSRSRLRDA